MMSRITKVALAIGLLSSELSAQAPRDSAFADLRADGNGRPELLRPVTLAATTGTAESLVKAVAMAAQLSVTFDASAPGRSTIVTTLSGQRPVTVLLRDIGDKAHLRIRVSPNGQLIVIAAPIQSAAVAIQEDRPRPPVELPPIRASAAVIDRARFETTADVGAVSFARAELGATPVFVEPDLLRSIQTMPGIEARSDYSAGFNVRGGEADQSMVMIDGYAIYNPYHLGGVFSTFIDPTVGHVELYRGNPPLQYGGRLSGVLDVRSAEPTATNLGGTVEVSLVSSTAVVGKAFDDGNGSWMVGARRTYADVVFGLFQANSFPYHFRDAQLHLNRAVKGFRLAVTGYDGHDVGVGTGDARTQAGWGNSVVGGTVSRHFDLPNVRDSVVVTQRLSFTRFDASVDVNNLAFHAKDHLSDLRARGEIARYGSRTTTTAGYEISLLRLDYTSNSPFNSFTDFLPFDSVSQRSHVVSAFADQLWRIGSRFLVDAGVRADFVAGGAGSAVSPRLSVRYFVDRNTAVTASFGKASQWMHSLGRDEEPIQPLQFWVASDSLRPISRVDASSFGLERWFGQRRFLHAEAFHKRYRHLLTPNVYNEPAVAGDEFSLVDGTSYGSDLMLRQLEGGLFSGWLAYTYALNSRMRGDGSRYYPAQDRRHNLNLVGSWHLEHYVLSLRANLGSGLPVTPLLGEFVRDRYDPTTGRWSPDKSSSDRQSILGDVNSQRLPLYRRIDVSVARPGILFGVPISAYVSVVNVLNTHNPATYTYDYSVRLQRVSIPNLPFVPTAGLSIVF